MTVYLVKGFQVWIFQIYYPSLILRLTNLQEISLLITTETKSSSLCLAESNIYRTLLRTSEIMEYFKSLLLCCILTKCRNHVTLDLKSPKIHRSARWLIKYCCHWLRVRLLDQVVKCLFLVQQDRNGNNPTR